MFRERKLNGKQSEESFCPADASSIESQSGSAGQYSSSSSSWHQAAAKNWALHIPFTWLGPLFRGRKPAGRIVLRLLSSITSELPSLHPCADLPVDPQCRRPVRPSHAATTCPLTSFSLQNYSRAWKMLL